MAAASSANAGCSTTRARRSATCQRGRLARLRERSDRVEPASLLPMERPANDETSPRYAGWRVVLACFLVALFIFGFGLYGHGVYVAELQRLRGWPADLFSGGRTP